MSLPGIGDRFGRYQIVRQLGRGGMGIVYVAVDTNLDREVALKVMLPSINDDATFMARFQIEAASLAKIRSRNVVTILDYGELDGVAFLVTELVPDGDLTHWLVDHGTLTAREALTLVGQVCAGAADAHAAGIIHRDIKPSNVLLWHRPEGTVAFLCDFGIATDSDTSLTRTGSVIGSLGFMAPERHLGKAADPLGDQYSAGCLLWACLTGLPPYTGTDFQVMSAHISGEVPQLPADSADATAINEILRTAMAKEPTDRYPSMLAMAEAITAALTTAELMQASVTARAVPDEPVITEPAIAEPALDDPSAELTILRSELVAQQSETILKPADATVMEKPAVKRTAPALSSNKPKRPEATLKIIGNPTSRHTQQARSGPTLKIIGPATKRSRRRWLIAVGAAVLAIAGGVIAVVVTR